MVGPTKKESKQFKTRGKTQNIPNLLRQYCNKQYIYSLVTDPNYIFHAACLLLFAEILLNICVIRFVKYTEIDWIAYMQEVEGFLNGTYDYNYLKGDTGPLVYPAGFVYLFSALYYITNYGENIRLAQFIFAIFHVILLMLVFRIYTKSKKVPPYVLVLMCCISYRVHSIFVLRLFNDPVAMLLFYASVNLFMDGKWSLGSLFYTLAVSVKMNILLFAPVILLTYLLCLGLKDTIIQLTICAFVQILLGLPFILTNPISYMKGAFNLRRIFLFKWTVNWRFLPEEIFTNVYFHLSLLILHIVLLAIFYKPARNSIQKYAVLTNSAKMKSRYMKRFEDMGSNLFILPLFTANLIGMACSRSLHYQFYVWYFHSLPYLLWCTKLPVFARVCILVIIELCWNTYPSTWMSSLALHMCHITMLIGLALNKSDNKNSSLK